MGARTNIRTVRIEWGDCDPMGIVYFPRYFAILDDCTWHLFEQVVGMSKLRMREVYKIGGFPLVDARARFLMTDLVLSETVTRLRARASAERAVAVAEDLLRSRRYEVLFVDAGIVAGALRRMARFADKRLSLADCASFEVMEDLGLSTAFTFDRDFRDCGYQMVPSATSSDAV